MTPTSSNTATTASVSPSVVTNSRPIGSPWSGADPAKLREAIARVATATHSSASTPSMDFGRYVRKELDRSPETTQGFLAMQKLLRLDPMGKLVERLDGVDDSLRDLRAVVEANTGPSRDAKGPASKSRRGRRTREAGLDCTGQMLTVLREDSRAAVLTGREWEERLKERFGKDHGFCRKTVEKQRLYKKQLRPAVEAAVKAYGPTFEADFLEHGLELWTHKPGRGDKRKDHTEKQVMAGREFLAALDNATIDAERSCGSGSKDAE